MFFDFRETRRGREGEGGREEGTKRKEERDRERERNTDVRKKHQSVASHKCSDLG